MTEEVEIRYRTETSTDPETGETTTEEVPYEYYILNVTLTNKTLPAVILPRLNEQQREIYIVMQQLKGNKPYLWEGIYNGGEDTGPSYEIPGEALDDPAFAALMEEATKYIGWPYVWGGSSPSTSFDCSGFVSGCTRPAASTTCPVPRRRAFITSVPSFLPPRQSPAILSFSREPMTAPALCPMSGFMWATG